MLVQSRCAPVAGSPPETREQFLVEPAEPPIRHHEDDVAFDGVVGDGGGNLIGIR